MSQQNALVDVNEVARVTSALVEFLKHDEADMAIKIAALNSAAAMMTNVVTATSLTAQIYQLLSSTPGR